jgi:hypothetical protein
MRSLALILVAFLIARILLAIVGNPGREVARRWLAIWAVMTIVAFLSGHYMVFAALFTSACVVLAKKMPNSIPALYVLMLPIIPAFSYTIPGAFGINKIVTLDVTRVLALALLLPAYLKARKSSNYQPATRNLLDITFMGYCLWLTMLAFVHRPSLTDSARTALETIFFLLVPYLAITRLLRTPQQLKQVMTAIVFTGLVVASACIVEQLARRHLYLDLAWRLSTDPISGFMYIHQYRFGLLRVSGSLSAGGLPFLFLLSLGALLSLAQMEKMSRWRLWTGVTVLALPILFTGSRGIWIAVAFMLAIRLSFALLRTRLRFVTTAAGAMLLIPLILDLILGIEDQFGTFDYRRQLLNSAMPMVLERSVLGWGSLEQLYSTGRLDHLIQGEGIIDMVNSFLGEALIHGRDICFLHANSPAKTGECIA